MIFQMGVKSQDLTCRPPHFFIKVSSISYEGAAQILGAACEGDFPGQENRLRRFLEARTAEGKKPQGIVRKPSSNVHILTHILILAWHQIPGRILPGIFFLIIWQKFPVT